jgi:cytochrome c553
MRLLALVAVVALAAFVWSVPSYTVAEGDTVPAQSAGAPQDEPAVDAGSLWKTNCASCHGAGGAGDTKMGRIMKVKDFTNAEVRGGFDRERMTTAVRDGLDDAAGKSLMKPYGDKLSAAEIAAVIDHIYGLVP